jgi:hypothetical protein
MFGTRSILLGRLGLHSVRQRQISGIVFGGGLALFAAQFLAWLF